MLRQAHHAVSKSYNAQGSCACMHPPVAHAPWNAIWRGVYYVWGRGAAHQILVKSNFDKRFSQPGAQSHALQPQSERPSSNRHLRPPADPYKKPTICVVPTCMDRPTFPSPPVNTHCTQTLTHHTLPRQYTSLPAWLRPRCPTTTTFTHLQLHR